MAEKGFKCFYTVLSLAAVVVLAACGGSETEKAETPAAKKPGTITVISGGDSAQERKSSSAFRTYNVRGESQISYAPEGAEVTDAVKNVQVVVAARSSPYASIGADLMAKRLSKDFIIYCSACHDDYGNGVIGPSLLGKNAKEVREMIDKYSREPDANVLMTDLVHRLSEEKIQFIAGDIARFNAELAAEVKKGRQNDWLKELLKSEEKRPMSFNKAIAATGCVLVAGAAGWMLWQANDVPVVKESADWRISNYSNAEKPAAAGQAETAKAGDQSAFARKLQTEADKAAFARMPAETAREKTPRMVVPAENLSKLYIVRCSACHGRDGMGPVGLPIAGKDYAYNLDKLKKYKAGQVANTMMADLLTRTSDEELEMLAREVSSFKK